MINNFYEKLLYSSHFVIKNKQLFFIPILFLVAISIIQSIPPVSATASALSYSGATFQVSNGPSVISNNNSAPSTKSNSFSAWEQTLSKVPIHSAGCFSVQYPHTIWQPIGCVTAPNVRLSSPHAQNINSKNLALTVGNGNDWSIQAPTGNLIVSSKGSFGPVIGLTSESDSIVGANHNDQFTIQLNSQPFGSVSTYYTNSNSNYDGSWEQFVLENDPAGHYGSSGATIFIQYWLFNYAAKNGGNCPNTGPPSGSSWMVSQNDCYANSQAVTVPKQSVLNLANISFMAMIMPSSDQTNLDQLLFCDQTAMKCMIVSVTDKVVNLSQNWNTAEFNIFGSGDGSQANFNSGTTITVTNTVMTNAIVTQGTNIPLVCMRTGFTGETNNLDIIPQVYGNPPDTNYCDTSNPGKTVFVETTPPPPLPYVSINCPDSFGVVLGTTGNLICTITSYNDFTGSIRLTPNEPQYYQNLLISYPSSIQVTYGQTSLVSLFVTPSSPGQYYISLSGYSNSQLNLSPTSNTVTVYTLPPKFTMIVTPASLCYSSGGNIVTTKPFLNQGKVVVSKTHSTPQVELNFAQNFDSKITWNATPPEGITINPLQNTLTPSPNYSQNSQYDAIDAFLVGVDPSLPDGNYTIPIIAYSGSLTQNAQISINVISPNPCTQTIQQGYSSAHPLQSRPPSIGYDANVPSRNPVTINPEQRVNPIQSSTSSIPSWVKNTVSWWSQGQVSDEEFVKSLQYLINEKVILVPQTTANVVSTGKAMETIPSWVKNTARMWAAGNISDQEFLSSVQYLISQKIIVP